MAIVLSNSGTPAAGATQSRLIETIPAPSAGWRAALLAGSQSAQVRLIGKDQFFGAAGEAPRYDYPNPLRPRPPTHECRASQVQLIGKDMFFGVGGPDYDYPNPLIARRLTPEVGTQSLALQASVAQVPRDPLVIRYAPQDSRVAVTAGLAPSWVAAFAPAAAAPIFGHAQALPVRARAVQQSAPAANWQNFYGATVTVVVPREPLVTRIHRRPFPLDGLTIGETTLGGKDIFYGEMGQVPAHRHPNPLRPQLRTPDVGQSASTALLTAPAAPPFKPLAFPNPLRRGPPEQPVTAGTTLDLNTAARPLVAASTEVPVRAKTVTLGFIQARFHGFDPAAPFVCRLLETPIFRPVRHYPAGQGSRLTLGIPEPDHSHDHDGEDCRVVTWLDGAAIAATWTDDC